MRMELKRNREREDLIYKPKTELTWEMKIMCTVPFTFREPLRINTDISGKAQTSFPPPSFRGEGPAIALLYSHRPGSGPGWNGLPQWQVETVEEVRDCGKLVHH